MDGKNGFTKEELRNALVRIYSRDDIADVMWDVFEDEMNEFISAEFDGEGTVPDEVVAKCQMKLAELYVDRGLSDDVLKYVNEHLDYVLVTESPDFVNYIKPAMFNFEAAMPGDAHCEIERILPVLGDQRAIKIGDELDHGGGGEDGVTYTVENVYYLLEDGTSLCTNEYTYYFWYDGEPEERAVVRIVDTYNDQAIPYDLEELFPEEYRFLN